MELGLSRMNAALDQLNLRRPTPAAIQVVGTNGKGSTAAFLEALGQAHGRRTGLFTSPHLNSVSERIRLDGRKLPEATWMELVTYCHSTALNLGLAYFEYLTLLAAAAFAHYGVEMAIWEAGLGGRYDATTALYRNLVCLTPIALDHEAILGVSLAAITYDKAGAMTAGPTPVPGLTGLQSTQVTAVLSTTIKAEDAKLLNAATLVRLAPLSVGSIAECFIPGPNAPPGFPDIIQPRRLGLAGSFQRYNSLLALAGFALLAAEQDWPLTAAACTTGLETAFIPGRFQAIPGRPGIFPDLLLDGGHNLHGITALATALEVENIIPTAIIFTCLQDKPLEQLAPLVTGLTTGPILIPELSGLPRARPAASVAAAFGARGRAVTNFQAALQETLRIAQSTAMTPVLICGSLFLLAEFFTLYPDLLDPPTS